MEGATKSFPDNYPDDALDILRAMSFTKGESISMLGSMSIRSQQYAGDYDAHEIVNRKGSKAKVLDELASEFKEIVKRIRRIPNLAVGDIKSGSIPEWEIFDEAYSAPKSLSRIDNLLRNGVITEPEAERSRSILKPHLSVIELMKVKKELRFNVVRWTIPEVLEGAKKLRDGRTYTLQEAFSSPSITKLDAIGFVQNNKFTEFSVIYNFKCNGKSLNYMIEDIAKSLKRDIDFYKAEGKPFKAMKRQFALAKFKNDNKTMKRLTPILNSDLGRIYSLSADIETLIVLLENESKVNMKNVRFEIDQFKSRIANVYENKSVIKKEHQVVGRINSALKSSSKTQIIANLTAIRDILDKALEKHTPTLRGGSMLEMGDIDRIIQPYLASMNVRNERERGEAIQTLDNMLRDSAHFYSNKDPAAALGYRVIADNLIRTEEERDGNPPTKKEEKSRKRHAQAIEYSTNSIINGTSIQEPFSGNVYTLPPLVDLTGRTIYPKFNTIATDPLFEPLRRYYALIVDTNGNWRFKLPDGERLMLGSMFSDNPSLTDYPIKPRDPRALRPESYRPSSKPPADFRPPPPPFEERGIREVLPTYRTSPPQYTPPSSRTSTPPYTPPPRKPEVSRVVDAEIKRINKLLRDTQTKILDLQEEVGRNPTASNKNTLKQAIEYINKLEGRLDELANE